jgi:hypothetical protein
MTSPQERDMLFQPPETDEQEGGKSRRGCIIGAAVAVLLLLILVAGGVYAFTAGLFQFAQQRQSNIPAILGSDTWMYGTITPALSDLPNIARLQAAYPQLFVEQDPEAANEQLEEFGLTFQEDIQPWLGPEVAFAIAGDIEALAEMSAQPQAQEMEPEELFQQVNALVLIASTNDEAAQEFLNKVRTSLEDDGAQFNDVVHQEVTIYEQSNPGPDEPPLAFAVAKNHVVFANGAAAIQALIDREAGGADSLESTTNFQRLRNSLPSNAIGYIYIDGQAIANANQQSMDQSLEQLPPGLADQFREQAEVAQAVEAVGLSISLESEGIAFDATVPMNLDQVSENNRQLIDLYSQPVSTERLANISDEALVLATFRIPEDLGEQFMEGFNAMEGGEEAMQELNMLLGINLEEDLLSWLSGEGSLVLMPGEQLGDIILPATAYISLQTPDIAAAEQGMQNIADVVEIQSDGMLIFMDTTLANTTWQAFQLPGNEQPLGGYATVNDEMVIAFGNNAMTAAATGSESPITNTPAFQAVLSSLPDPNTGVSYVNVPDTFDTLDSLGTFVEPPTDEQLAQQEELRRNIEPIRGIGGAASAGFGENGVARTRMFVYIQPVEGGQGEQDGQGE